MIVSDEHVARFVSEQVGRGLCPPFTAMGTERHGKIINGVIFNCFEGADVHVTIAGHGWTKGFLADVGYYAFDVLKVRRITAITAQPKVVRIAERLGGQIEGRLRHHFEDGGDGYIIGILREDWPY